jgi:hypothetical protein
MLRYTKSARGTLGPAARSLGLRRPCFQGEGLKQSALVHPAIHNANLLSALVVGEPVSLASRHAKVRRRGYQTQQA